MGGRRSAKRRPRGYAVGLAIGLASIGVAAGVVGSAGDTVVGGARAGAPAQRSERQTIVDPQPCGVTPGLFLNDQQGSAPLLVFHRFDGNVLDDLRVQLPGGFYGPTTSSRMTADCRAAIVSIGGSGTALRVDQVTGAVTSPPLAIVPANGLFPLNDGRLAIWGGPNSELRMVDAQTGTTIESWSVPRRPSALESSRSGDTIVGISTSIGNDGIDVTVLPFPNASTITYPFIKLPIRDRLLDVDISPSGSSYLISVSTTPTTPTIFIYDLDGTQRGAFPASSAEFETDSSLIVCQADGAYRSDFAGNQTLIEAFDDFQNVPIPGGNPIPFSRKRTACLNATG